MNDFYKKFNMIGFPAGNTGAQMGGWWRKEINTVADLQGVKFRVGYAGSVLAKLGVVPQNIAGGEIYPALERGTIDAAEWVGPYDDEKLGFDKVAKFYYYPGWWEGGTLVTLLRQPRALEYLPPSYKAAVQAAAAQTNVDMQAQYDALNPKAIRRPGCQGRAAQALPAGGDERVLRRLGHRLWRAQRQSADFKKVWESMKAFRAEENLWFQLTEANFDAFSSRSSAPASSSASGPGKPSRGPRGFPGLFSPALARRATKAGRAARSLPRAAARGRPGVGAGAGPNLVVAPGRRGAHRRRAGPKLGPGVVPKFGPVPKFVAPDPSPESGR